MVYRENRPGGDPAEECGLGVNGRNTEATPDEIANEWDTVKSHLELAPFGHLSFQPP